MRVAFVGVALLALTLWAFFWMKSQNASDGLARSVAVNTFVVGQVFYLLNSRCKLDSSLSLKAHFGNRYLAVGIGAVTVLQLLFTYAPPLQELFDTEAIPLWVWPRLLCGGLVFFFAVETEKLILLFRVAYRLLRLRRKWPPEIGMPRPRFGISGTSLDTLLLLG